MNCRIIFTAMALAVSPLAGAAAQLYMAGDSIMTEYPAWQWPQYGWGQALKVFMKDPSALHNFARSGWSARRFRESGRWEKNIASQLKPGDWVIVSFGHNDMNKNRNKPPKNDYSTIDEYKAFLKGFAADAKEKGANIAFATSIAHSKGFSETDGVMSVDGGATGLGPYVAAMREVAAETGAPLLDLNRYAGENLPKLGLDGAKRLYMVVKPGEYTNYPDGKTDPAHIRDTGAFFYAKGAVEMAREQNLPLADLLKNPSTVDESLLAAGLQPVVARLDIEVSRDGKPAEKCAIVTRSGEEGEFKKVTEYIYPTKYNFAVTGSNGVFSAAVEPDGFTMREVGFVVKAKPVVYGSGWVRVELNVEEVPEPTWTNYGGTVTASDGSKSDIDMEQPTFTVRSLKGTDNVEPGKVWSVKGDGLSVNVKASILDGK